jgi:two-component system, sensor histidine kinase LadS
VGAAVFRRFLLALFLACAASSAVAEEDHVVAREVLEDPDGTLTVEEASELAFEPLGLILARGFTASAHWLRLTVRSRADGGELVLRIRPAYLDEIVLYEPDTVVAGSWIRRVTGDRTPLAERDIASTKLGFAIVPAEPETTYYLRLQTTSTSLMSVEALEPRAAARRDLRVDVLNLLNLGLVLWILLWATQEWLLRRERVIGLFALSQLSFLLYDAGIMGYLAPLAPEWVSVDTLTSFFVCLTPILFLFFNRALIVTFKPNRLALRALDLIIVADAAAMALLLGGQTSTALWLNSFIVLLTAPVLVGLAFTAREDAPPGRAALRTAYSLQAASLVVSLSPLLGFVQAIGWNLYALTIHGLVSGVLIFVLLYMRSREIQQKGVQAAVDLIVARQQLEIERDHRDLQDRFMAMLSHELKTPLSVIRIAVGMLKADGEPRRLIDSALENVDGIVDRCTYADLLDQQRLEVNKSRCDVADVIADAASRNLAGDRIRIDAAGLPAVNCDRPLLGVMLGNLIDNALKYSQEGSEVDVLAHSAERDGRSGIAIAVENRPGRSGLPDPQRVFDKFYRGPGAKSKSGSGLGLYIVRGIAELSGGKVDYETDGGRARFRLWLPC